MTGCILTPNRRDAKGYGHCNVRRYGRSVYRTHIVAWIDAQGHLPPPETPLILHSCDNPPCVNPDHLRAGTHRENMDDRKARRTSPHLRKTHCPQGHPYDEANTAHRNGRRHCRTCDSWAWRQWKASGVTHT